MRYSRLIAGALLSLTSMGIPHTAIATDLQGDELANAAAVLAQQRKMRALRWPTRFGIWRNWATEYRNGGARSGTSAKTTLRWRPAQGAFLPPLSPTLSINWCR